MRAAEWALIIAIVMLWAMFAVVMTMAYWLE